MQLINIKGVGQVTLSKLKKLGINSCLDVLNFMPKKYLDMSSESELENCMQGDYVLLKGEMQSPTSIVHIKANNMFKCKFTSQNQIINLVWFNSPYLRDKIFQQHQYFIWGKINIKEGKYNIYNPSFELASDNKRLKGVVAVYPLKNMVGKSIFSNIVDACLNSCEIQSLLDKREQISLRQAYYNIHKPSDIFEAIQARKRIEKENLVNKIIAHRLAKNYTGNKSQIYGQNGDIINNIISQLTFNLTQSQQLSLQEILQDLNSLAPMNRMLLGDVGSGKTIVALLSMYYAAKCGHQCAMIMPTALLAKQHYETALRIFKNTNVRICLLLGDTSQKDKNIYKNLIKKHQIDIVFGTHALLVDDVCFDDLTYVIVDELHKFGVKQKSSLQNKSPNADCLIMSATPIPRVVALCAYGDVSISKLAMRKVQNNIATYIISDNKLNGLFGFINQRVQLGEQAFVVCPLVEDSDGLEVFSAKSTYEMLMKLYPQLSVGLIYGKQKEQEKQDIMQKFSANKISVLVATSVVEVGIDCPNASIMVALNSDRFGLASLHQLRGRVGRNPLMNAHFFLHTSSKVENERLQIIKNCVDGEQIATYDASLRGYGDFLGLCQSGGDKDIVLTKEWVSECNAIADKIMVQSMDEIKQSQVINNLISKLSDIGML